jgi:hypothetical protein
MGAGGEIGHNEIDSKHASRNVAQAGGNDDCLAISEGRGNG